jgi:[ribosomal protein S18]-alanine N-acetyltransferase
VTPAPGADQVRIERMRWWHVAALLPLEEQVFTEQPWSERTFWSELGQLDTRFYVVALASADDPAGAAAGGLVGYAGLCDYPDEAWVQTMAVAPAWQGRGLGTRLLGALLDEAARRRQRVISLEVRAGNAVAQRLYERHGFVRTGVRRGYYQPGGEDAVVMTRRT